jgi:hypothetical protein
MIRAGDLEWELADIRGDDWDGLNSYLAELEKVVAGLSVNGKHKARSGNLCAKEGTKDFER